ncbi:hypothetical protein K466DRAFT_180777 [Polyporus arcularius HHB13444]|uniref:F-box domain-containing protein n=1 Tax=Polyporus arcularius HHB13444 TaxID=1314778 RepID=A0A5C3P9Q1_9APHY|nr:hypothetical protein K466DRAFT_180777 [Polyporus arcularius HHB13444]
MSETCPLELTDRIISFVDILDKATLCNCALVCHSWLPASRHALFRRIDVADGTVELLVSRVLHSESVRPYLAGVREFRIDSGPFINPCRLLFYHLSGHLLAHPLFRIVYPLAIHAFDPVSGAHGMAAATQNDAYE